MNANCLEPIPIQLYISPEELRELADKMEHKWQRSLPGDSLIIKHIYVGTIKIEIVIDQEQMRKKEALK